MGQEDSAVTIDTNGHDVVSAIKALTARQIELQRELTATLAEVRALAASLQRECTMKEPAYTLNEALRVRTPSPGRSPDDSWLITDRIERELKALDKKCAAATELAAVNCARIQEILTSRTWCLLTRGGGLVLRLLGRSR